MTLKIDISKPVSAATEIVCPDALLSSGSDNHSSFEEKDILEALQGDIEEFLQDELADTLNELLDSVSFEPKARYYLAEAYDDYTKLALDKAKKLAKRCWVTYCLADENGFICEGKYNVEPFLKKWVIDREEDCLCSIDVGGAIIRSMEQYVRSASWHYDLIIEKKTKVPKMWFGLSGKAPEEGWILNIEEDHETTNSWTDFWFCDDSWEDWKNRVPDADDIFLTWMTAECDLALPSLEDVLESCPIQVDDQDDFDSLTAKIAALLEKRSHAGQE